MSSKSVKNEKYIYALLILITAFCLYVKARYGICEDEEFFVSLIYRISKDINNTIVFKVWDSYQLTGTIFSPFVCLYHNIFNNYDYLYLILRLLAISLLVLATIYFYNFCRKELSISKGLSFVLSIIYLLSVPKLGYNIDNSLQLMIYYTIFSCELYKYIKKRRVVNLIISALFYCFSILAYVTVLFSFPVLILLLCAIINNKKDKLKSILLFSVSCLILGIIFLLIFINFKSITYDDLIYNISQIVEGESVNFNVLKKLAYDIKRYFLSFAIFYLPLFIVDCIFYKNIELKDRINKTFVNVYTLINVVVIVLTFTEIIKISIFTLMVRLIPLSIILITKIGKDKFNIINFLYIVLLIICYTSTDQYIDTQARYIFTSILLSFGYIYKEVKYIKKKYYVYISFIVSLVFAIYSTGIYVPIDMNSNSNIFAKFVTTDIAPFQGLYLDEDRKADYEDLHNFNIKDEPLTIVSGYMRGCWYVVNENDPITPFTETGYLPEYKWVNYFEHNNINKGILLVHTKYYKTIDDFAKHFVFGEYILNNYNIKVVKRGSRFVEYEYEKAR